MRCPNCGTENPEGKLFCGDCGSALPQPLPPPPVQPTKSVPTPTGKKWLLSNWKALTAILIVIIVVFSTLGLVYSQPWSKVKVLVNTPYPFVVELNVWVNWNLTATIWVDPSNSWYIVGVWPIEAGSLTISIDHGYWHNEGTAYDPDWQYYPADGHFDFVYRYQVGPLYTKNVFIQL